jgi:hypothetical protein
MAEKVPQLDRFASGQGRPAARLFGCLGALVKQVQQQDAHGGTREHALQGDPAAILLEADRIRELAKSGADRSTSRRLLFWNMAWGDSMKKSVQLRAEQAVPPVTRPIFRHQS